MLNYAALKSDVKATILSRLGTIEPSEDPLIWSWMVHALSLDNLNNRSFIEKVSTSGIQWLSSEDLWKQVRNLSAISSISLLIKRLEGQDYEHTAECLIEELQKLRGREQKKHGYLNDPQFVYPLVIGVSAYLPSDLKDWLKEHCTKNAKSGKWNRSLLFAASAKELDGEIDPISLSGKDVEFYDLPIALWFSEKYTSLLDSEERKRSLWQSFETIREGISLAEDDSRHVVSNVDLAMLYEALLSQVTKFDPIVVFNNFPWHPKISSAAQRLYLKGEYVSAVFEAAKLYVDEVKKKAENPVDKKGKPLDGTPLMEAVFQKKNPMLKFNELSNQTEENEQTGLRFISQGVVAAFRNPKGHLPASGIAITPEEALEQLAVLSYLMRRLDASQP